jgi:hypothetical protein
MTSQQDINKKNTNALAIGLMTGLTVGATPYLQDEIKPFANYGAVASAYVAGSLAQEAFDESKAPEQRTQSGVTDKIMAVTLGAIAMTLSSAKFEEPLLESARGTAAATSAYFSGSFAAKIRNQQNNQEVVQQQINGR